MSPRGASRRKRLLLFGANGGVHLSLIGYDQITRKFRGGRGASHGEDRKQAVWRKLNLSHLEIPDPRMHSSGAAARISPALWTAKTWGAVVGRCKAATYAEWDSDRFSCKHLHTVHTSMQPMLEENRHHISPELLLELGRGPVERRTTDENENDTCEWLTARPWFSRGFPIHESRGGIMITGILLSCVPKLKLRKRKNCPMSSQGHGFVLQLHTLVTGTCVLSFPSCLILREHQYSCLCGNCAYVSLTL